MKHLDIFRHAPARYQEGFVKTLAEASDLTPQGVEEFKVAAQAYAQEVLAKAPANYKIKFYCSPYNRAMHTLRLIIEAFENEDYPVKPQIHQDGEEYYIRSFLGEIDNFDFRILNLFVSGKALDEFPNLVIDSAISNPDEFEYLEFYFENYLKRLPLEILKLLPPEILIALYQVESSTDIIQRTYHFLQDMDSVFKNADRVVAVTHESVAAFMVGYYTDYQRLSLPAGRSIACSVEKDSHEIQIYVDTIDGQVIDCDDELLFAYETELLCRSSELARKLFNKNFFNK